MGRKVDRFFSSLTTRLANQHGLFHKELPHFLISVHITLQVPPCIPPRTRVCPRRCSDQSFQLNRTNVSDWLRDDMTRLTTQQQDEHGRKRVRAKQACRTCNARRVKCNVAETQPCSNCQSTNSSCEVLPSRRGR